MRRLAHIVVVTAFAFSLGSAHAPVQASSTAMLARAQKSLDAGRPADALKQASALVVKYPKLWQGHRLVGRAALMLDQPDRAESAFRQALRLAPAAGQPSIQNGLREAANLRSALAHLSRSRALRSAGDAVGAAEAEESAYLALPSRFAYGLSAAERFEAAGRLDDAKRVLEEVRAKSPTSSASTQVDQRLTTLTKRIEVVRQEKARQQAADELARKEAEERKATADRQAELDRRRAEKERQAAEAEAERKRVEAERKAEEERVKAEKARQDREETDRLNRLLGEQRSYVSAVESTLSKANSDVDDCERSVRRLDGEADDARERRNRAKRERDEWQDKVDNSKRDIDRDINRVGLRSAEAKYDDAKGDYDRINRRFEDAKSRLSQAKQSVDDARRKVEQARQDVRETEDAIARIASG